MFFSFFFSHHPRTSNYLWRRRRESRLRVVYVGYKGDGCGSTRTAGTGATHPRHSWRDSPRTTHHLFHMFLYHKFYQSIEKKKNIHTKKNRNSVPCDFRDTFSLTAIGKMKYFYIYASRAFSIYHAQQFSIFSFVLITWNIWLLPNWYDVGTRRPDDVGRYIILATLSAIPKIEF